MMYNKYLLKKIKKKINLINKISFQFMRIYNFNNKNELSKENYLKVHKEIALLLRDDLKDISKEEELNFLLEQDWYSYFFKQKI